MLQAARSLSSKSGFLLRRYLDRIPFLRPGKSLSAAAGLLAIPFLITAYSAWLGIQKWGYTQRVDAKEFHLEGGGNLGALWYSEKSELLGYRQEGWKLTLLRWDNSLKPFSQVFDLDQLTPADPQPASSASPQAQNHQPLSNSPYLQKKQMSQFAQRRAPVSATANPSVPTQNRTASPLATAVSQDFSLIAWAWREKLYVMSTKEEASAASRYEAARPGEFVRSHSHPIATQVKLGSSDPRKERSAAWNSRSGARLVQAASLSIQSNHPTHAVRTLDLPKGTRPIAIHLVAPSGAIVQDSSDRVLLYDIKQEKMVREIAEPTPCAVTVTRKHALLACPTADLAVLNFSSSPPGEMWVRTAPQNPDLGFTAFALSPDGTPAAATDSGAVLLWHLLPIERTETAQTTKYPLVRYETLQSPGVAQVLAYNGDYVLVGGGFRGIYLLEEGKPPTAVVGDVAGTTLLAISSLSRDSADNFSNGELVLATREGSTLAYLTAKRSLNDWGIRIAELWLGFWGLILVAIPGGGLWIEEIRRQREVRLRAELERSLERVPTSGGEPTAALPVPDPPEELIKACIEGNSVAFIGAGMGAQSGLPTWRPLIQSLLSEVSRQGLLDTAKSQSFQEAFSEGQTDLVADGLVDNLRGREQVLYDSLSRTFLRQDIRPTRAHNLLRSLNLSAVLTTSFDNLLDITFSDRVEGVYTHQDADKLLEALTKRKFFLLKAYGALDRPDSVILASFQYYEAMARNLLFSRFMEQLFTSRTLLFVGAGLEGIESYLTGIKFPTSMPQRHFALVAAQSGGWRAKADLLVRRYGIQILGFTPQTGYPEVEQFLSKLSTAVGKRGETARSAAAPARSVSRLQSVTLDNIGPFDHLELDLDAKWNILLGDNGVGKSTILKAIAVGIAGADAADFAGRLIKSGKEKEGAKITLRTSEGKSYITEIRRGDRTIVESQPSRPLEPERWLALGFPPLRSFTMAPAGDLPPKGLGRLTSEDVMPLIRGEIDPRLDKLKAWIIDLDYRDKESKASNRSLLSYFRPGETSTQFTRLLDQFFEVIRRLTPGLKLGKVEIDSVKKEVRVETEDGLLRIELVSQGTQSLLGWVGILLQRLNDFYSEGSDGRNTRSNEGSLSLLDQHALVLMDEIDAHMHPRWQQFIVHALKGLLPNAQFIASTHSPLIVAGMDRSEVRVARRAGPDEPNAGHVLVEWPKQKLRGLRADQILTGNSLFNMESTLTPDLEAARKRYTALAAKDTLTPEEQSELERLAENIEIRVPAPHETEVARLAFEKMQEALEKELSSLPAEKRKRLLDEAKVQIQENITGSRRP